MNIMTSRTRHLTSGFCAVLVGGALLATSGLPARADNGNQSGGFRDFRQQNPGLDRHTARNMFRAERRIDRTIGSQGFSSPTMPGAFSFAAAGGARAASGGGAESADRASRHAARLERQLAKLDASALSRQSLQSNDAGRIVRLNSGINLDLTSSARNIVLGTKLFSDGITQVQINVAGETKTLIAGSQVTAAEYVAAKQVIAGQAQSVSLSKAGAAIGGNIDLGALTVGNDVMRASNLVVSNNVTTSGDFGKHSDFRLQGDLVNFGTLNAFSSDSSVRGGTLSARDITNHAGGLISSAVDLTLDAAGNLRNDGIIVSTQGLTLSAGGSISNSGAVRAENSVSLNASSINNQGLVQSRIGDVNLDGSSITALRVNNSHGTIAALNGAINLRNTAYSGTGDSTVIGGDLLSRDLNLNAGQGLATVSVNELTGTINETGLAAHVTASTAVLNIGNVCLTGDPTFYNQGDINITANISVPEDLVIVASGDITSAADVEIRAADASLGYDITMIAGADFIADGGANSPTLPGGTAGGVSLSGKSSKTGGGIRLGSNVKVYAQVDDTMGNLNGGNILMVAFAGKGSELAGKLDMPGVSLRTGGLNLGNNGNITLIAGLKSGTAINSPISETTGGSGAAGNVSMFSAAPISSIKGQTVDYDATGLRTSTASLVASSKLNKADIIVGGQSSGTEIQASGNTIINAGGMFALEGQIVANGADIRGNGGLRAGDFANVTVDIINLETSGDIGTEANPFRINANELGVNNADDSKGKNVFLRVFGTGTAVAQISNKGRLVVDASQRDFSLDSVGASSIELTANAYLGGSIAGASDLFSLTTLDANADLVGLTLSGADSIVLISQRDVGSSISPNLFGKVKNLTIQAGQDSFFGTTDKKTVIDATAGRELSFVMENGGTVLNASSNTGNTTIQANSGVLEIADNVSAGTDLSIVNASPKSNGKIIFATDASAYATSDISISIGITSVDPVTNIDNVELNPTLGTITVTGSGIKAKPPTNSINALVPGSSITVNNGYKEGNIMFGGGVDISVF
jgi:adhesin HecA-like repeat protein